jgi:iodotyrosine deiodinase
MLGYGFILVFKIDYDFERLPDGGERKIRHYYVNESVGVACGAPLAALRNAGWRH